MLLTDEIFVMDHVDYDEAGMYDFTAEDGIFSAKISLNMK
jgi:hypothetical protein